MHGHDSGLAQGGAAGTVGVAMFPEPFCLVCLGGRGMAAQRLIRYGELVSARDIERYPGGDPARWLTTLVRLLIQAELGRERIAYVVPQVTDHIMVRDGGVDASLEIGALELAEGRSAGLINRGRTVYQFKWRTNPGRAVSAAAGELRKLQDGSGLPDVYVQFRPVRQRREPRFGPPDSIRTLRVAVLAHDPCRPRQDQCS